MRALIINQHTSNHGDEAAGRALLLALCSSDLIDSVDILYNAVDLCEAEKMHCRTETRVSHYPCPPLPLHDKFLVLLSLLLPVWLTRFLVRKGTLGREMRLIRNADVIINAPGGVNIGPYRDWRYLWRLNMATRLGKPVAIYSISFGPIPHNPLFRARSIEVLSKARFLSLRDKQSQAYADEYGIEHVSSIDTAFLDDGLASAPTPWPNGLDFGRYVVVVPNNVCSWHPAYAQYGVELLDKLYSDIITLFLDRGLDVVLLPQLFGRQNDSNYMERLRGRLQNSDRVFVIPDEYDCDVQQRIVSGAEFVVAARYHSVIFAIRGEKPFYALSYEHKIEHTLSCVGLGEYAVDLRKVLEGQTVGNVLEEVVEVFSKRDQMREQLRTARETASVLAKETYARFEQFLGTVQRTSQDDEVAGAGE